jgi:hypothetical protein
MTITYSDSFPHMAFPIGLPYMAELIEPYSGTFVPAQ